MTLWASGTKTLQYRYDGEGRRVQRISGGNTTMYVYGAEGELVAEYGASEDAGTTGRVFLAMGHLGATRVVTSASGSVLTRRDYFPFGEEIPPAATYGKRTDVDGYNLPYGSRLLFTGQMRDGETGLDYFGERYFSAAQGRFTSPDALIMKKEWVSDPQRWNHYAYVRNNPLK